jgi:Lrp/AsnC family transcriptional regulator, leucine-responsive regulatory protein
VDAVDEKLINALVVDGRASLTQLGAMVRLSIPAVKRRLARLEREGVIRGYTAVIDERARAQNTEAFIELFCSERVEKNDIVALLESLPEVRLAFSVAGDSDAVLLVRTADPERLEQLLIELRRSTVVQRTRTQLLLTRLLDRGTRT